MACFVTEGSKYIVTNWAKRSRIHIEKTRHIQGFISGCDTWTKSELIVQSGKSQTSKLAKNQKKNKKSAKVIKTKYIAKTKNKYMKLFIRSRYDSFFPEIYE